MELEQTSPADVAGQLKKYNHQGREVTRGEALKSFVILRALRGQGLLCPVRKLTPMQSRSATFYAIPTSNENPDEIVSGLNCQGGFQFETRFVECRASPP